MQIPAVPIRFSCKHPLYPLGFREEDPSHQGCAGGGSLPPGLWDHAMSVPTGSLRAFLERISQPSRGFSTIFLLGSSGKQRREVPRKKKCEHRLAPASFVPGIVASISPRNRVHSRLFNRFLRSARSRSSMRRALRAGCCAYSANFCGRRRGAVSGRGGVPRLGCVPKGRNLAPGAPGALTGTPHATKTFSLFFSARSPRLRSPASRFGARARSNRRLSPREPALWQPKGGWRRVSAP